MRKLLTCLLLVCAALPCMAQRYREVPRAVAVYNLYTLGGGFPPTLNSADPATDLKANETPDCYGLDLSKDGKIGAVAAMPTGTTRIQKTYVVSTQTNYWHYNRLWYWSGTTLNYYAPLYNDVLVKQRNSAMDFSEDSNAILTIVPFGSDDLFVSKATGGYVVGNCADTRALFQRSDIFQEVAASSATRVAELDGSIFVSNSKGLIGLQSGRTVELTRPVRDDLSAFTNLALTVDYEKHRIIGTGATNTGFVYDASTGNLYRYAGTSAFRYTTRQFRLPDWQTFNPSRIIFVIQHGDTKNGQLKYQVKLEEDDWGPVETVDLDYVEGFYVWVPEDLRDPRLVNKFQVRVTALDANKYIREIRLDSKAFDAGSYVGE